MAETVPAVVETTPSVIDKSMISSHETDSANTKHETSTMNSESKIVEDDLEDGEIETDEDDDEPVIVGVTPATATTVTKTATTNVSSTTAAVATTIAAPITTAPASATTGGAAAAAAILPKTYQLPPSSASSLSISSSTSGKPKRKRRRSTPADDWAGDLEHALAVALKKDGIEPNKPKVHADSDDGSDRDSYAEDVRRAAKRMKKRDREKKKGKRSKHSDGDRHGGKHSSEIIDVDIIDEDEMLCVRGGSPTPAGNYNMMHMPPIGRHRGSPSVFNESEDSYQSSDDSYDSADNRKMSYDDRRSSRRTKDRRNRGGAGGRGGGGGGGGGGSKRRNRHESDGDDCPRSHDSRAPRKLELCKFYLMECCAKKEKCSYMHSDFPCKYYYLGMECVYKEECKFSHGEPLTEQLKNVLLKHIETAPKEILGNFRRISRDVATQHLLTQHAKLCAERGIENTFELPSPNFNPNTGSFRGRKKSPPLRGMSSFNHRQKSRSPSASRGGGGGENNRNPFASSGPKAIKSAPPMMSNNDEENWDADDWDKPANNTSNGGNNTLSPNKSNDKPRKSRWQDFSGSPASKKANSSSDATLDILSLRNLKGVITPEQIERLEAMGIENLEQISQLTVGQLNSVGLTISQINEIQLNAMNMDKLGVRPSTTTKPISPILRSSSSLGQTNLTAMTSPSAAAAAATLPFSEDSQSMWERDIDMRVLVGAVQGADTSVATSATSPPRLPSSIITNSQTSESSKSINQTTSVSGSQSQQLHDLDIMSPEPIRNSEKSILSGSGGGDSLDFSQYLKDSNLKDDVEKTNFNDILKEDIDPLNDDDPGLLIDESNFPASDDENATPFSWEADKKDSSSAPSFNRKGEDDDNWDDDTSPSPTVAEKSSSYKSQERGGTGASDPDKWSNSSFSFYSEKSANTSEVSKQLRREYYDSSVASTSRGIYASQQQHTFANDPRNRSSVSMSASSSSHRDPRASASSNAAGFFKPTSTDSRYDSIPNTSGTSSEPYSIDWTTEDYNPAASMTPKRQEFNSSKRHEDRSKGRDDDEAKPKYQRTSIYDWPGDKAKSDDQSPRGEKHDESDPELSDAGDRSYLSLSESGDIDPRLPFKPVMTNFTPATEIDGSIASHPPIPYKVSEVYVPKPTYDEIRRSIRSGDKTLDPRLRRILCLKDSGSDQKLGSTPSASSSEPLDIGASPSLLVGGPPVDPRLRAENSDAGGAGSAAKTSTSGGASGLGQSLLQKSKWYRSLNSKFKIMVNMNLALVTNELKLFHRDPNPDKVFDMKFLMTNPTLQQIMTNLGIFIDGNGEILQMDTDNDDGNVGVGPSSGMMGPMGPGAAGMTGMMMPGGGMMMDPSMVGMGGMDYMRNPQGSMGGMGGGPMNVPGPYMGGGPMSGMMNPYGGGGGGAGGPRFDMRINMSGAKNNPFAAGGRGGPPGPYDEYGGVPHDGGGNAAGNPFNQGMGGGGDMGMMAGGSGWDRPSSGGGGGNRGGGNRNFRQGGGGGNSRNISNNDRRWGGNSSGGGGGGGGRKPGRNNYESRGGGGGGGGNRRNDMNRQASSPPSSTQHVDSAPPEEEECWD